MSQVCVYRKKSQYICKVWYDLCFQASTGNLGSYALKIRGDYCGYLSVHSTTKPIIVIKLIFRIYEYKKYSFTLNSIPRPSISLNSTTTSKQKQATRYYTYRELFCFHRENQIVLVVKMWHVLNRKSLKWHVKSFFTGKNLGWYHTGRLTNWFINEYLRYENHYSKDKYVQYHTDVSLHNRGLVGLSAARNKIFGFPKCRVLPVT